LIVNRPGVRISASLLMLASGFAGLAYQIVWTQQSAVWLGHEAAAMLAIVAAYFGGLGLGSLWLGKRIEASPTPARWYAGCELIIGLWALALTLLLEPASRALLLLMGPQPGAGWQWTVAFIGTFLLLLPATAAMGATLPAMERIVATARAHRAPIALLYAANTFGAVLGVVSALFWLVPRLGLETTVLICAGVNLLCAGVAWRTLDLPAVPAAGTQSSRAPLAMLAISGFAGIGYEVLVVRALSQVAENTLFTFALLLSVYLVGTALGAAAYARLPRTADSVMRDRLLRWQVLACLAGVCSLVFAAPLRAALLSWLGTGMGPALLAEATLGLLAFLLPTLVMGALFSHLMMAAGRAGCSLGTALGVNTLAAALAPPVFGVWLLPALGASLSLLLAAVAYLLLTSRRGWSTWQQLAAVGVSAAFVLWRPQVAAPLLAEGSTLVSHDEGVSATVSVVESRDGVATLHINNRQQEGSSVTTFSDSRQALLPLLLHPAPERALFLGLGTGATARAALADTGVQVEAVELLPAVVDAAAQFARRERSAPGSRMRTLVSDARRFLRATTTTYDVIVSDNFHPARSGSAALYTVEHFEAVRGRLRADGLFCQWLPLHQLDVATLRSIVASYTTVFPRSWAILATHSLDTPVLGLVARRDDQGFEHHALMARLGDGRIPEQQRFGFDDAFALLGMFVADADSLRRFAASAPPNTDDRPVVAWLAPRHTYSPAQPPRELLLLLMGMLEAEPTTVLTHAPPDWPRRLASYWAARDQYLAIGSSVRPDPDVRLMLSQVQEPLFSVLQLSAEFRPAYDPLVRMAQALARTDAVGARQLLVRLAALQPAWPEARLALAELTR
jgi:spermidine synthase